MTDDELDAIERDYRGVSEVRKEFCTMCEKDWELWKVENKEFAGMAYSLHHHIAPWDYDYGGEDVQNWADPRPEIKKLLDEVRRLKEELAEDGL